MVAPSFLVIGAQKAGTNAISVYLNKHRSIFIHTRELHFFDKEEQYEKGIAYYEKKWSIPMSIDNSVMIGEKTPIYCFLPKCIERIHRHYPNMKLVLSLREPVSRAYSQYNMDTTNTIRRHKQSVQSFRQPFIAVSFLDMIQQQECTEHKIHENGMLARGFYIDQIEHILEYFPPEQLHIVISEEIRRDPISEYTKLFRFLGVEPISMKFDNKHIHSQQYMRAMTKEEFFYLHQLYQPYNERLYHYLGRRIPSWENKYAKMYAN